MAKVGENWKCPYCGHAQVVDQTRFDAGWHKLEVEGEKGGENLYVGWESTVCANDEYRELSLAALLGNAVYYVDSDGRHQQYIHPRESWRLLPPSSAKPQPKYVPEPIRDDYYEACSIRDLSPKASATIIRRCLQGIETLFLDWYVAREARARQMDKLKSIAEDKADQKQQPPKGASPQETAGSPTKRA